MSADDDPSTEELRAVQASREVEEREREAQAEDPDAAKTAQRRADKAAYLREKLEEQAEADDE